MGGLVGGISFALTLGLNVIQVPLLLRFWPQETYGLWISVGALSTFLTTLDGGHQLYVGNLLTRYYVEDREAFHRTLASAIRIASLTSAAQIILAIVFCFSGQAANWLGIESRLLSILLAGYRWVLWDQFLFAYFLPRVFLCVQCGGRWGPRLRSLWQSWPLLGWDGGWLVPPFSLQEQYLSLTSCFFTTSGDCIPSCSPGGKEGTFALGSGIFSARTS